jgi:hypothetical protein
MSNSVFRSAITGTDGSVDPGYLALFWTMCFTVSAIPFLLIVTGLAAYHQLDKAGEIIQSAGVAIGAICTGAGVVIGAVGAFRMGDKPRVPEHAAPAQTVNVTANA